MSLGKLENGRNTASFMCLEDVQLKPFYARCTVQAMRDGNMYITQLPKRKRNKALYRDDNSTLTFGYDGRYYFSFSMPKEQVMDLPGSLVIEANNIAEKFMKDLIGNY